MLIDIYVKYGLLKEGVAVATTLYVDALNRTKNFVDQDEIFIPYNKFDELEKRALNNQVESEAVCCHGLTQVHSHA